MKLFYDKTYSPSNATFDTHAKARLVANRAGEIPGVVLTSPRPATVEELNEIHHARYVKAVMTGAPADLASSNGFEWSRCLRDSVLASTGGVRDAVIAVLNSGGIAGSLSSGLHHAGYRQGGGYCTVNGLALGALTARRNGAERVLIIDFDAHCGGGTASIIEGVAGIEQIDVSVSAYDRYEQTKHARLWMSSGVSYLDDVIHALESVLHPSSIDIVIYNAGVDAHERAGGLSGITTDVIRQRESQVVDWSRSHGLPMAFTLAGGYSSTAFGMEKVANLHTLLIEAANSALCERAFNECR